MCSLLYNSWLWLCGVVTTKDSIVMEIFQDISNVKEKKRPIFLWGHITCMLVVLSPMPLMTERQAFALDL